MIRRVVLLHGQRESAGEASGLGDKPDVFVHGSGLVVTDDVASLHVVAFFGSLVGDMALEDDAITSLRVNDHVFLGVAPILEFITYACKVFSGVEMGRLDLVSMLDKFEVT